MSDTNPRIFKSQMQLSKLHDDQNTPIKPFCDWDGEGVVFFIDPRPGADWPHKCYYFAIGHGGLLVTSAQTRPPASGFYRLATVKEHS